MNSWITTLAPFIPADIPEPVVISDVLLKGFRGRELGKRNRSPFPDFDPDPPDPMIDLKMHLSTKVMWCIVFD